MYWLTLLKKIYACKLASRLNVEVYMMLLEFCVGFILHRLSFPVIKATRQRDVFTFLTVRDPGEMRTILS